MKLHESRRDGVDVFHLEGQIDLHYAPALRAVLEAKANSHCPALVLDLSGVTFIDSTGIAVLIEYLRDSSEYNGHVCLAGVTRPVQHIFETVGLDKAMPVFNSETDAIAAICSGCVPEPPQPLFRYAPDDRSSLAA
jgi:anti-sigma B factor antagonist